MKTMKAYIHGVSLIIVFNIFVFLSTASLAVAQTYQHVGNVTYGSDGTSYQHVGNVTYGSDGTSYQHVGNVTYGSRTSYQHVGNVTYGSDCTSYQHVGNVTYGSTAQPVPELVIPTTANDDMKKNYICALLLVLVLASCATQPEPDDYDVPGFFSGLWHGFIIFFDLIGHIFDTNTRIYAFPNSGGWYDLGFCIGAGSWGGLFSLKV